MNKKRICLFAGFDKHGILDDYVLYYIKELSKLYDVFYWTDNSLNGEDLNKLKPYTKFAMAQKHGKYDFGSWSEILNAIGYEALEKYDEMLLVNDSCFGPIFDIQKVFNEMSEKGLDAWGMCGNKFIMSFFIVLKSAVFRSETFKCFFRNIVHEEDKVLVIKKYEQGFSKMLTSEGFKTGVYLKGNDINSFYKLNRKMIKESLKNLMPWWGRLFVRFSPNKVRLYSDDFILPFLMRMPLLKKNAIYYNENLIPVYYRDLIVKYSNYPASLIENNYNRIIGKEIDLKTRIKLRVKNQIKRFISDAKYRRNKKITRIFTIPVKIEKILK